MAKEIFYHGSSQLFDHFDMSHALEGDGKVKFGYGVYVTSSFASAAHYAGKSNYTGHFYVYTVEVPEKQEDNFIAFRTRVSDSLRAKIEQKLGKAIPERYLEDAGKFLRKYIALTLADKRIPDNPDRAKPTVDDEKAASEFLLNLGIDFIEWPYSWTKPEDAKNRAILDDKAVRIIKIEEIEFDEKKNLIEGSQKTIFEAK